MGLPSWPRLSAWVGGLREQVWLVLTVAVLVANTLLAYWLFLAPAPPPPPPPPPPPLPSTPLGTTPSPLTGAYVPEDIAHLRPVAVMVDNFATARPQSGLNAAILVWETLVEGGVTRFLAVYQTIEDVTIGPVRSAREYFLPWVEELDAIYAHSGGSAAVLQALRGELAIDDADEFVNGQAYFRSPTVPPPHNLYTTPLRLEELRRAKGWRESPSLTPWLATDEPLGTGERAEHVTITFSSVPAYRVQWRYDNDRGVYLRSQGGVVVSDRETRAQLSTKNVIVQFTEVIPAPAVAPDAVAVTTVGRGQAWFFRDGQVLKGRWEKATAVARTTFLGPDGSAYAVARGGVWVEVVPVGRTDIVTFE